MKKRVILHIDMDAFYCQVERFHNPSLLNVPIVVVQYNPFGDLKTITPSENRCNLETQNGSIIAVSYEARKDGVKRLAGMRAGDAKKMCPALITVQVPTARGKADLSIYREAGNKVVNVLGKRYPNTTVLEKASIDEVYMDITDEVYNQVNSFQNDSDFFLHLGDAAQASIAGANLKEMQLSKHEIRSGNAVQGSMVHQESTSSISWFGRPLYSWSDDDKLLAYGSKIAAELRRDVKEKLGFECTAGIAHNKMLAKIASAMHKPNQQTVVPGSEVERIMQTMPLSRVPGFGGKLGSALEDLLSEGGEQILTMGQLAKLGLEALSLRFGQEDGEWIMLKAQGIDTDEVTDRPAPLSISCGKSFRSSNILPCTEFKDGGLTMKWLTELCGELLARFAADEDLNQRKPRLLTAGVTIKTSKHLPSMQISRSCQMPHQALGAEHLAKTCLSLGLKGVCEHPKVGDDWYCTYLDVRGSNFETTACSNPITQFFKTAKSVPVTGQVRDDGASNSGGVSDKSCIGASNGRSTLFCPRSHQQLPDTDTLPITTPHCEKSESAPGSIAVLASGSFPCPICQVLVEGGEAGVSRHIDRCLMNAQELLPRAPKRKAAVAAVDPRQGKIAVPSPQNDSNKNIRGLSSSQQRIQQQIEEDRKLKTITELSKYLK